MQNRKHLKYLNFISQDAGYANFFSTHWTFCPANRQIFAGHFSHWPDISKSVGNYRLVSCWTFCPVTKETFAGHFKNSPYLSGMSGKLRIH